MCSFLISPALFARNKPLLKLPSGHKDCYVGTEQVGPNCCFQGRVFALKCPACEIQRWTTSSPCQGSAQYRTQGREYLTPENHLGSQNTALPCSKYSVLPGEQGVSGKLRGSVTSTARASKDPQICAGSCFVMGKKVHQQIRQCLPQR